LNVETFKETIIGFFEGSGWKLIDESKLKLVFDRLDGIRVIEISVKYKKSN